MPPRNRRAYVHLSSDTLAAEFAKARRSSDERDGPSALEASGAS